MKVNFPPNCTTEASKLSYLHRIDELMRLDFNDHGASYRSGGISEAEWESYKRTFKKKNTLIHVEINRAKTQAQKGTFWGQLLLSEVIN